MGLFAYLFQRGSLTKNDQIHPYWVLDLHHAL